MTTALRDVNWIAILTADVALFALGALWFMLLFGKTYRVALGREQMAVEKPSALFVVGPFACQTLVIITTALLMRALHISTYPGALEFGLIVGIGYLAPMVVNIAINPNFPRPFLYSAINAPFFLLGSVIASLILVAMG